MAVLCASVAHATVETRGWRIDRIDGIVIRTRYLDNGVTEFLAEGTLKADAADVEAALTHYDRMTRFMPYVEESRVVGKSDDGGKLVYTLLDFPFFLPSHDFVLNVHVDETVARDGQFHSRWAAEPDIVAEKKDVVRVPVNEGEWIVRPTGEGKSHAIYRFAVNPGDEVPSWAEDFARKDGVVKVFKRVEREGQDLAFKRHYYPSERRASAREAASPPARR